MTLTWHTYIQINNIHLHGVFGFIITNLFNICINYKLAEENCFIQENYPYSVGLLDVTWLAGIVYEILQILSSSQCDYKCRCVSINLVVNTSTYSVYNRYCISNFVSFANKHSSLSLLYVLVFIV